MNDKELEELRAQRQLILKHLNWLDAQIASAENCGAQSTGTALGANIEAEPDATAPVSSKPEKPIQAQPLDTPEAEAITPEAPSEMSAPEGIEIEEQIQSYAGQPRNDIQRAKVGCLLFFIGAISLFIFLLFGLPYLLD